jgi:dTDP-4-amino-4,6-dideoxygalactose transaminase
MAISIPEWPAATERELQLLREVIESGRWGGYHEFVARFEAEFASFQQCRFGVAAMNGTVTLEMALAAAGIGPGDEVIVPAISFISTATAVSRIGAIPVFVDIEPLTFNMDPERAAAAISARTKAILVVHFGGPMARMDRLGALAAERGLLLIEDAAHAHGSEWNGRRAGSIGLAGSFSFQNSKVMTAGEGGILLSNDEQLAARARSIADQGRRPGGGWFHHYILGTNYRITALQAAVLIAQLERLPAQIDLRMKNAAFLRRRLAEVPGLHLQQIPPAAERNAWYLFLGRVDARKLGLTRDEFCAALAGHGIPGTPFYPHALYGNPLYQTEPCRVEPCPVAEECIGDAFWLPHRVLMGDEEQTAAVCAAILEAVAVPRR